MCISILILTLNEERNILRCLESVRWSDDIVVLDSGSTDRTVEIAERAGARVVNRPFDNWASHQNWANENIEFRYPWVYYSDADEIVTDELRHEMVGTIAAPAVGCVAFRVRYKNYFMGRWIRHCGIYPVWVLRLFRPDKVAWTRLVNPVAVVAGQEGRLTAHFLHYSFNNGFEAWFAKHNRYSSQEAEETVKSLDGGSLDLRGLVSIRDPARRRRALKELSFRMPFRPSARFIYMYFFRAGILDSYPGLVYCLLLAMYERMIVVKVMEIRRARKGLAI